MKIAIPVAEGNLFSHFGHSRNFALIDVDQAEKKVLGRQDVAAPPHEPGLLPGWLAQRGVQMIIAGGMGERAVELCRQNDIEVIVGAPAASIENLVETYLSGRLQSGDNRCDH